MVDSGVSGELVIRLQVARPVSRNSRSNIAIASAFTAKATIRAIITSACGTRSPSNPATTALKLGFVTEELFDRVVDPAKMVRPYVAVSE